LQASLDVSKEVHHELDGLIDTITFMCILNAIVEVQQQTRNSLVRVDVDPVPLRQDLVILSDAGFPDGGCVTGLWAGPAAALSLEALGFIDGMFCSIRANCFCNFANCFWREAMSSVGGSWSSKKSSAWLSSAS
jgi:hypothetical protein